METYNFDNEIFYKMNEPFYDYWISKEGRVLSTKNKKKPTILSFGGQEHTGYYRVTLWFRENERHRKKQCFVHRLLAEHFIPLPNKTGKLFVNHKDGNKLNNSLENLEWVTTKENIEHGFQVLGRVNGNETVLVLQDNQTGLIFEPVNQDFLKHKHIIGLYTTRKVLRFNNEFDQFHYCFNKEKQIEKWHNGKLYKIYNNIEEIADEYDVPKAKVLHRVSMHYAPELKRYRLIDVTDFIKTKCQKLEFPMTF